MLSIHPPQQRPGRGRAVILRAVLTLALVACAGVAFASDDYPAYRLLISSPSVTSHSGDEQYQDFHPGLGLDLQVSPDRESPWNVSFGGYNMDEDSHGRPMWWAGVTTSYTLGDRDRWWIEPGLFAGLMHKHEVFGGEPTPFALPELAVGYGPLGVVGAYIPATPLTNNVSIALFMLRLRLDIFP